jgi:hypothetical protein
MSRTHRIGSRDLGFPLRELKERKTLGARALAHVRSLDPLGDDEYS